MTTTQEQVRSDGWLRPWTGVDRETWPEAAHRRLDRAHALAPRVEFDDQSRLVFFSDSHRGDGGPGDFFAHNAGLFLHALRHYEAQGFTYLEVGDGDELWQNGRFDRVRHAYGEVFDLLQRFWQDSRLHLIIGNHDSLGGMFDPMQKDGIPVHPGVVLRHANRGRQIFVVHGHQADRAGDRYWRYSRLHTRYIHKHVLRLGFDRWHYMGAPRTGLPDGHHLRHIPRWLSERILRLPQRVAAHIKTWSASRREPVICGHTHLWGFPPVGAAPYFNTGSCINPGYLTGLELVNGRLTLVKWTAVGNTYRRQALKGAPVEAYW